MDDLISRQKVLQCIKESRDNIDWGQSEEGDAFLHYSAALYRTIASKECLSSAQTERKGMWIHERVNSEYSVTGYFILRSCECSECGEICEQESNFCPNCGAHMRGKDNE